jgi:hypothetical protein
MSLEIDKVDWIHPSYRDLIIEELAGDPNVQRVFLRGASLEGIKLALSDASDRIGARKFLLLGSKENWEILLTKCSELASKGSKREIVDLLEVLSSTATQTDISADREHVLLILREVCQSACVRWNTTTEKLSANDLRAYCRASTIVTPLPPIPDLTSSWLLDLQTFRNHLSICESRETIIDPDKLTNWVELVEVIEHNEPRFLRQVSFPEKYNDEPARLMELIQKEHKSSQLLDTYEELKDEARRLSSMSELLSAMSQFFPKSAKQLDQLAEQMEDRSEQLRAEAEELAPDEDEGDYDWHRESKQEFDIDALFSDL